MNSVARNKIETAISQIRTFLEVDLVAAFDGKQCFEPQVGWAPIATACIDIRANDHFLNDDGKALLELMISRLEDNLNDIVSVLREAADGQTGEDLLKKLRKAIEVTKSDFSEMAGQYQSLNDGYISPIINYGRMHVGDVFKDIRESQIINRSIVNNTLNNLRIRSDENLASFVGALSAVVEKSQNKEAGELLDQFNEELSRSEPRKSLLRRSWKSLVEVLPDVAKIAGASAALAKLIG
ncbi:hypothetical protein [Hoeflea alexandrii]|uniref:Uncharacterized protein n=1 Tax=Hoeflea alexandrii TaxID=288436 RepID=A0ABT1CNR2_9HYPH|nr:hypothetical protein [Hoeflea alexandrii]MCO6407819.1 hypothetical protein [Hoeflea alexandrii]MCY0153816.1 hypothetical protein [Hoeflea alexandrii]